MVKLDFRVGGEVARQLFGDDAKEMFEKWAERANQSASEPFFYQVIVLTNYGDDLEKCKQRIRVTGNQMRRLEILSADGLLSSPGLQVDYDVFRGFKVPKGVPELSNDKETRLALRNPLALDSLFSITDDFHAAVLDLFSGLRPIDSVEDIEELGQQLSRFLSDYDSGKTRELKEAKAAMNLVKRLSRQSENDSIVNNIANAYNLQRERSLNDFLRLKAKRVRELGKADANFAKAYLKYTVVIQCVVDTLRDQAVHFPAPLHELSEIPGFIKRDDELYQAMLERFDAIVEPSRKSAVINGNSGNTTICHPVPEYKQTPQQLLTDAIFNRHGNEFSADAATRVRYFVNEDVSRYNGDMTLLRESFGKFKLGKRLREVGDIHVRNFFDDVMLLEYLIPGKTPSVEDLERVYEGCSK